MGTFDPHVDSPEQIKQEGEELIISFERTGSTTGRVSWIIPPPANGCTSENQAYCGIVVLLNTIPNKAVSTWPHEGVRYNADPTGDPDLFTGDQIGGAFVVGAFYDDRTTTSIDITGLDAEQTYFFTGHITSCVLVYHRQGMSTYALPYLYTDPTPDFGGHHEVALNSSGDGITGTDSTGLSLGTTYCIFTRIDGTEYDLFVNGTDAQTYDELTDAINKAIKQVENPQQSPVPPDKGAYYFETTTNQLFQWDGFDHVEIPVISELTAPTGATEGDYWLDTDDDILYIRQGSPLAWVVVTTFESGFDPANPECDSFWFDGTQAWSWDGSLWCERTTIIQTTDPSCDPDLNCGAYWFDESSDMLFEWDEVTSSWVQTEAIVWDVNPRTPAVGTFWFNDETNELFSFSGPGSPAWIEQTVLIQEDAPLALATGSYWFQDSTQTLFVKTAGSPAFTEVAVLIWGSDPTLEDSCELWWSTTSGSPPTVNDELFSWSTVGSPSQGWVEVSSFTISSDDPSVATALTAGTVWVQATGSPSTNVFWNWDGSQFVQITSTDIIEFATDPVTTIGLGSVWHDTVNNQFFERTSGSPAWELIDVISSISDPASPTIGDFWFNLTDSTLNSWNGTTWVNVAFSTLPITPSTGTLWFDTTDQELMEWNGTTWVTATPIAITTLNDEKGCASEGNIIITSTTLGCEGSVRIGNATTRSGLTTFVEISFTFEGDLFDSLAATATLKTPVAGTDGLSGISSYDEIGVGTDGSADERRELADSIRKQLGYPVIEVELTKYQINEAIQSALEELRLRSASAYRRVYFFLHAKQGFQKYVMTNECVGFNTIVNVQGIWRITSAFMSTVMAAGVYGQTVLQHLYHMGTFDLVSYHLVAQYIEELEQLFATRVTFTWDESSRELYIFQQFTRDERMLLDCVIERTEQELMTHRSTKNWIERWAMAQCQLTLAAIRGKYAGLPGAGGGVALNAGDLEARAAINMETCIADIDNFVVNDIENLGIGSELIIG